MTPIDAEFYCLLVVAGVAVWLYVGNRRLRRKLRATISGAAEAKAQLPALSDAYALRGERILELEAEVTKQKVRASLAEKHSVNVSARLQECVAEKEAAKAKRSAAISKGNRTRYAAMRAAEVKS